LLMIFLPKMPLYGYWMSTMSKVMTSVLIVACWPMVRLMSAFPTASISQGVLWLLQVFLCETHLDEALLGDDIGRAANVY
jgi:hypothetical protein